jgi:hypothetical protein
MSRISDRFPVLFAARYNLAPKHPQPTFDIAKLSMDKLEVFDLLRGLNAYLLW